MMSQESEYSIKSSWNSILDGSLVLDCLSKIYRSPMHNGGGATPLCPKEVQYSMIWTIASGSQGIRAALIDLGKGPLHAMGVVQHHHTQRRDQINMMAVGEDAVMNNKECNPSIVGSESMRWMNHR